MTSSTPKEVDDKAGGGADVTATSAPSRQVWSKQVDFIISVVGFCVGLGNVWRFPYLCYKNGGGAFLVPYLIFLVCGGVPVFFLEVALGQYMSQGGLGAWDICPIFKGIGVATTVIVFLLNVYYIVILSWGVYYCYESFTTVLPWSHCNNSWNTERCRTDFGLKELAGCSASVAAANYSTAFAANATSDCLNITLSNETVSFRPVDPVVEFWERNVLEISSGIDNPDGIVLHLFISLLIVWVVCYFCVWKGIRWTGKVVYFTATFPYIILTVLLIRGVTLDGAVDGLTFYLKPDFSKLGNSQVWIDAGTQIFFSYAIAVGCMTALGSYNRYHNNFFRDCILISCINSSTSLYAGFAIFSVLGFMAKEQGVDISKVAESGPGLVFIAYPKAVTQMPAAPLWAVLFFVMIFLLGLDSQFVGLEGFITVGCDLLPLLNRRKEIFVAIYCIVSCVIALPMVTRGGMYVFQLFDYYSASGMALIWVCFFECIAIAWVYGVGRFYDNIKDMLGFSISRWLMACWKFVTPLLTAGLFIFMWAQYKPLTYNRTYEYPGWAIAIGMCMAFASMICIPVYVIVIMILTPGTMRQRWSLLTTPVLIPDRIPSQWPDSQRLRERSRQVHVARQRELQKTPVVSSNAAEQQQICKEDLLSSV